MKEELMEFAEEMQVFLHKGNKLVSKIQKHAGMPMSGMGQRNRPHDLPPAFPQYDGDYDMYMGDIWENQLGQRQGGGMNQRMGQRGGGMNQRSGQYFNPDFM